MTSTEQPVPRKLLEEWSCWRALAVVVADSQAGVVFSSIAHGSEKPQAFGITWQPGRGKTINSQRSTAADAVPLISLPLSGAQRTWPDLLLVRPRRP